MYFFLYICKKKCEFYNASLVSLSSSLSSIDTLFLENNFIKCEWLPLKFCLKVLSCKRKAWISFGRCDFSHSGIMDQKLWAKIKCFCYIRQYTAYVSEWISLKFYHKVSCHKRKSRIYLFVNENNFTHSTLRRVCIYDPYLVWLPFEQIT